MISFVIFLTWASAVSSAFIASERHSINPPKIADWRKTVKLDASYLDGLGGGGSPSAPKPGAYSPFKKNPSKPASDVQPYINEAKNAAAQAIGHVLEAKAASEEALEWADVAKASNGGGAIVQVTSEPPEIVADGLSLMRPNGSIMHGEDDPTVPGSLALRTPLGRDYIVEVGPQCLNFRESFAPYPKGHSMTGRGSFDSFSQTFVK
uniref:Uncharacterized protein n=1 Tax=Ditylum brightwellii TaxID=49249 RepID=A0A6U3ZS49_9STRA|mmetsp:Transcript_21509/g.32008  ORF Transcript_21509/g.32008 Transcript_21509/m.32008 type:complete len:207 (+) Transcript_21509:139-759(+)